MEEKRWRDRVRNSTFRGDVQHKDTFRTHPSAASDASDAFNDSGNGEANFLQSKTTRRVLFLIWFWGNFGTRVSSAVATRRPTTLLISEKSRNPFVSIALALALHLVPQRIDNCAMTTGRSLTVDVLVIVNNLSIAPTNEKYFDAWGQAGGRTKTDPTQHSLPAVDPLPRTGVVTVGLHGSVKGVPVGAAGDTCGAWPGPILVWPGGVVPSVPIAPDPQSTSLVQTTEQDPEHVDKAPCSASDSESAPMPSPSFVTDTPSS